MTCAAGVDGPSSYCRAVSLDIETRDLADPDVLALIDAVQDEYLVRYGSRDESEFDAGEFVPPRGLFLVGVLDGVPVAMGGWRVAGDAQAEVKRMYVAPEVRRRGLSRLLLAELERTAAEAGVRRMILMTGQQQPEAVALYLSCGYQPIDGYGYYASHELALFYAKELAEPGMAKARLDNRGGPSEKRSVRLSRG